MPSFTATTRLLWFAFALVALTPPSASAHIQMSAPVSRKLDDAVKTKPCGGFAKGAAAQVDCMAGQPIKVDFREIIDQAACFQLSLSTDNDVVWTMLARDAGVTCQNC